MAISNIEGRERISGFKTDFDILEFRRVVKGITAIAVMFSLAALPGLGRISTVFQLFQQTFALVPGLVGDYLRVAYDFMTLRNRLLHSRICLGLVDYRVNASAIVMANVGAGTTIGAGTVVTRPIPAHVVAVGNPAREIDRPVP